MMKLLPIIFLFALSYNSNLWGDSHTEKEINLKGRWRFEIGDDPRWAEPDWDDSDWDVLYVPAFWEDQDYPGYDGYAWYRRSFEATENMEHNLLYLHLGHIDDVDEVYLNGKRLGCSGQFPPNFITGYNIFRSYYIPKEFVNFGRPNILAVRVYDDESGGGITKGDLGIFLRKGVISPDLDLAGYWKFNLGDDPDWSDPEFSDSKWQDVMVPGYWRLFGYGEYDGMAWYRKHFSLPFDFRTDELILLLGKIDDCDEVYLNGEKIGNTGPIPKKHRPIRNGFYGDSWLIERAYHIPSDLLKRYGENVIAIRVYDAMLDGGIYDVPVGIIAKEKYHPPKKYKFDWEEVFLKIFKP